MKRHPELSDEDFNILLNWFSANSDEAGEIYKKIHSGLERFFRFRGCADCITLADETINRVAIRLDTLTIDEDTKITSIFYGFALNVFKEYLRDDLSNAVELTWNIISGSNQDDANKNEKNLKFDCLDVCLDKLKAKERKLIKKYYSKEKAEKIILRKKMSEELGITQTALHVRIYRLKEALNKCIQREMKKKM